jgi:beta-galactosidase
MISFLVAFNLRGAEVRDWENEQVLHINTEPPRATFVPFATVAQALNEDTTNSPFYFSLNGLWKFNWVPRPELRPKNFLKQASTIPRGRRLKCPRIGR